MDLIIFDCDGVLVDSEPLAIQANIETLAQFGVELTVAEVVESFVGRSMASIRAIVDGWIGTEAGAQWQVRFRGLYYDLLAQKVEPVDGVIEALDQITAATCVASSGALAKIRIALGRTGMWDRFEGRIFTASDVEHGKPAPDLFLHAAARMGVPPHRCVVIEDSRAGVEAARAAGMPSFGYTGGVTPADALAGPGTTLFADMRRLPALLGG